MQEKAFRKALKLSQSRLDALEKNINLVSAFAEGYFGALTDTKPTALTITFDQATDTLDVSNKTGVDKVLSFSENIGQNYSGTSFPPGSKRNWPLPSNSRPLR